MISNDGRLSKGSLIPDPHHSGDAAPTPKNVEIFDSKSGKPVAKKIGLAPHRCELKTVLVEFADYLG